MRRLYKGILTLAFGVSLSACLDLDVVNENSPDRERALSQPADVENVIMSSFRIWYNVQHSLADVAVPYPQISDEMTNTVTQQSIQWSAEPRQMFRNDQLAPEIWIPRRGYDGFSECVANTNDGLREIKEGMRIMTLADPSSSEVSDNTDRAYVWGKLWQGVCIGYLALQLDRFAVATEDSILPEGWAELAAWEKQQLSEGENWPVRLAIAINSLEQAIDRATNGAQWVTPDSWIPGQRYNNEQVIQLANTMIARLLVYSARYPEDREALDWDRVLAHAQQGLTYDFGPILVDGVIEDPSYLQRLTTTGTSQLRADYRLIGPADQSGNYQAWLALPVEERTRFQITTPDRRITGTTPTSNGAYFRHSTSTNGFDVSRGEAHWSYYQWHRRANYGGFNSATGHFVLASADENRLFQAEALLRLGMAQQAADLINVTRTRAQQIGTTDYPTNLPPVTVDGAPLVDGSCVPRKDDGTCGDLMDALKWERAIELTGIEPMRAWFDRRGFGQLQPGTWVQNAVPARYLVALGIPAYTFGGIGGDGAAR